MHSPAVIALSGCSRSGKSRVAGALRQRLGATVVEQDRYWTRAVEGSDEDPRCTDWSRFHGDVAAAIGKGGVVVVEGFQVLHDARIAEAATLAYHLVISK